MRSVTIAIIIVGIIAFSVFFAPLFQSGSRMYNDGIKTVEKIYTPSELLKKYEFYKDLSSTLDRRKADISVYDGELSRFEKKYEERSMPKDEREYYNKMNSERLGLINSYNQLASEYNSAMSKFNYRFCNVGDLPKGATDPLPREFKSYIYNSN